MTSSDPLELLADLGRFGIVVPFAGPIDDDGMLVRIAEEPMRIYRFFGGVESTERLFPYRSLDGASWPTLERNREILDRFIDRGRSLLVVPYLDRPFAYAVIEERTIN